MLDVEDLAGILRAVDHDRQEINMAFHFQIAKMDHGATDKFGNRKWELQELKPIVCKWQNFMHDNRGWNAIYLENLFAYRAYCPSINDNFFNDLKKNREGRNKIKETE